MQNFHIFWACAKARFNHEEYVVTFPVDLHMSEEEVKKVLEAEYKLLCLCDTFKHAFDEVAHSAGVTTIPGKLNSILDLNCN